MIFFQAFVTFVTRKKTTKFYVTGKQYKSEQGGIYCRS